MPLNLARCEVSDLIVVDDSPDALSELADGWTAHYVSLNRVGSLVVAHFELSWEADAVDDQIIGFIPEIYAPIQDFDSDQNGGVLSTTLIAESTGFFMWGAHTQNPDNALPGLFGAIDSAGAATIEFIYTAQY